MRRLITILIILLFINQIAAQTTSIPDPLFEWELIAQGLDVAPIDGSVPTANIDTLTRLVLYNLSIADLTGIEDFTALTYLDCYFNALSSLDLSQNTNLTTLRAGYNQLTNLDVSQNVSLTMLDCIQNQLISLDVSSNPSIDSLLCSWNLLTQLNLTQNPALKLVHCHTNQLTCLNLNNGNNTLISYLEIQSNPGLTCIQVDDSMYSTTNWPFFNAIYSENCQNPCTVGVEEINKSYSLNLYPNPTVNWLAIEGIEVPYDLVIFSALGRSVFQESDISEESKSINVNSFADGLYYVRIEIDGEVITRKMVKR